LRARQRLRNTLHLHAKQSVVAIPLSSNKSDTSGSAESAWSSVYGLGRAKVYTDMEDSVALEDITSNYSGKGKSLRSQIRLDPEEYQQAKKKLKKAVPEYYRSVNSSHHTKYYMHIAQL